MKWLQERLQVFAVGVLLSGAALAVAPNDPYYHSRDSWQQSNHDQWALRALAVYDGPDNGAQQNGAARPVRPMRASADGTATGPLVAVIDTGIDLQHEDLARDRLWRNGAETANGRDDDGNGLIDDLIGWNFVDHTNLPDDRSGHGTHVSGVIAACTNNGLGIAAVAPDARIMPLKVAHFAGQARSAAIAAAVDYATAQGADIINLSLVGTVATPLEADAIARAQEAGALVVVSAGNAAESTDGAGFAALPGVLVVGASTPTAARARFSNFGARLDVLAPGVDVLSLRAAETDFIALTQPRDYVSEAAVVGEQGRYYRASGTSFAAALVSGLAARLLTLRPALDAVALRRIVLQSATDVDPPGVDQRSGYGLVRFPSALRASTSRYVEARIERLSLQQLASAASRDDSGIVLAIHGVAAADALASVAVQVARADADLSWEPMPLLAAAAMADLATPDQVLGGIALDALLALPDEATDSSAFWLRLLVTHRDGEQREARMQFVIPTDGGTGP